MLKTLFSSNRYPLLLVTIVFLSVSLLSCGQEKPTKGADNRTGDLAGTWVLESRIQDEQAAPAGERLRKLVLKQDGTFACLYKGEPDQQWIDAGSGAFSFFPPLLRLYWNNGIMTSLLVVEKAPDRMRLHHGTNLVPLKEQEPDEVFVRRKQESGPKRGAQ